MAEWWPFWILSMKKLSWVIPYILFAIHRPDILLFFSYVNITKLLKFKMAAKQPF